MMRAQETKDASGSSHYGIVPRRSDSPGARLRSGTAERANRLSIGTEELLAAIDLAWEIESTAIRFSRIPPSCAREETPESRGLFLNTEQG